MVQANHKLAGLQRYSNSPNAQGLAFILSHIAGVEQQSLLAMPQAEFMSTVWASIQPQLNEKNPKFTRLFEGVFERSSIIDGLTAAGLVAMFGQPDELSKWAEKLREQFAIPEISQDTRTQHQFDIQGAVQQANENVVGK